MKSVLLFAAAAVCLPGLRADVRGCACDPANPSSLEDRSCSLTREALKQPAEAEFFYLKDNNPRKPNRWLALPRSQRPGPNELAEMPSAARARYWKFAIAKARELWGNDWGVAINSIRQRTQCHAHIHIGKLLQGLAPGRYVDVSRPEEIPVPNDGTGLWIHPVDGKLRVHLGEEITETVLLR